MFKGANKMSLPTLFKCPSCKQAYPAEVWTDKTNESEQYPDAMDVIDFEDVEYRVEYWWDCPGCEVEVAGTQIEEEVRINDGDH